VLDHQDHQLVKQLLLEASQCGSAERDRYLDGLRCSAELRRELTSLLSFSEDPADRLDLPLRLRPGQLLVRRYRVERLVGRGGASEVYSAFDRLLARRVALKVLHADVDDHCHHLLEEHGLARRVRHPGVCRVFACERHQGLPFLVLELIEGESLATRLARVGPLPCTDAVDLGRQLAAALAAAHDAAVLHGDLKPANLLLDRDGRLHITDFGVASSFATRTDARGTRSVRVTAAYMAPEAFDAGRELTTRSDLYSLGAVLYELVTATKVFAPTDAEVLAEMHRSSAPVPPSRRVHGIERGLELLILRLLAKRPADRPRSAREVLASLAGLFRGVQAGRYELAIPVPAIYGVSRVTLTATASV
jgi:serine/threonine-protein kinase